MFKNYKNLFSVILFSAIISLSGVNLFSQYTISGFVYYTDNGMPVTNEYVYILDYNPITRITTFIDSAILNSNGSYTLNTYYSDSVLVCLLANVIETQDHVTTYYPSTIDWLNALPVYPPDNPTNINIEVTRIISQGDGGTASGTITTLDSNNNSIPLAGAIVVAEDGSDFESAAITDSNGKFTLDSLSTGVCTILSTKIGYLLDSTIVTIGGNSVNVLKMKLKRVKPVKHNSINSVVSKFALFQNYPNPFNPTTKIKFQIPFSRGVSEGRGVLVRLTIFDLLGREIATLINESLQPGTYEISWDTSNFASGIYFYELRTDNYREAKKMTLIR